MSTPNPTLPREELRRRFNEGRYWDRMLAGEFVEKRIGPPHKVAYKGVLERHPEAQGITAEYYDADDNTVAQVHYYIDRPGGQIIPGKRPDPKLLYEDGNLYHEEKARNRMKRLRVEYEDFKQATMESDGVMIPGYASTNSHELKTNTDLAATLERQAELSIYLHSRWTRVVAKIAGRD